MKQNSEVETEFRFGCLGLCIEGEVEVEVRDKMEDAIQLEAFKIFS